MTTQIKKIHPLFILLFVLNSSFAFQCFGKTLQIHSTTKPKDSLEHKKLALLLNLYWKKDHDSVIKYSGKLLDIAKEKRNKDLISAYYDTLGIAYHNNYEHQLSNLYLDSSLTYYKLLNWQKNIARTYIAKAANYIYLENYELALEESLNALEFTESDSELYFYLCNNLSRIYSMIHQYDAAAEYLKKALDYAKRVKRRDLSFTVMTNLGMLSQEIKDYSTASVYLNSALKLADSINDDYYIGVSKSNLAYNFYLQGFYDKSIVFGKKALKKLQNNKINPPATVNNWIILGNSYTSLNQYTKASDCFTKSLFLSKKIDYKLGLQQGNMGLYSLYKKNKNVEKALYHYEQAKAYEDSLLNISTLNKINQVQTDKIISKKNEELLRLSRKGKKQIEKIQKDHLRNIKYIILVIIIILIFAYSLFQRKKITIVKQKQRLAENDLKILRSQMNPHFIFNALNSIQSYVLKKDSLSAYHYLTRFSDLIRLVLKSSVHSNITLKDEIDLLRSYVELECMRFDEDIRFVEKFNLDETKAETIEIPSMIIQPIIENSIIHGLSQKENGGTVELKITQKTNTVLISIKDNGIGRKASQLSKNRNHLSVSSINTSERISILKEKGFEASYQIEDIIDEHSTIKGTNVQIVLPILNS